MTVVGNNIGTCVGCATNHLEYFLINVMKHRLINIRKIRM